MCVCVFLSGGEEEKQEGICDRRFFHAPAKGGVYRGGGENKVRSVTKEEEETPEKLFLLLPILYYTHTQTKRRGCFRLVYARRHLSVKFTNERENV